MTKVSEWLPAEGSPENKSDDHAHPTAARTIRGHVDTTPNRVLFPVANAKRAKVFIA